MNKFLLSKNGLKIAPVPHPEGWVIPEIMRLPPTLKGGVPEFFSTFPGYCKLPVCATRTNTYFVELVLIMKDVAFN